MSMNIRISAFILLSALVPGTKVRAQADRELYVEVARSLRKELPQGVIVTDPNVWQREKREVPLPDLARAGLQLGLGAETGSVEKVVSCPGGPESCRLTKGVAIVSLGETELSGDTARVRVHYAAMTGGIEAPVTRTDLVLVLVKRRPDSWSVIERILLRIS